MSSKRPCRACACGKPGKAFGPCETCLADTQGFTGIDPANLDLAADPAGECGVRRSVADAHSD